MFSFGTGQERQPMGNQLTQVHMNMVTKKMVREQAFHAETKCNTA